MLALTLQASLNKFNKKFELVRKMSDHTEFECTIRGGLTTNVYRKFKFNNKYLLIYKQHNPIYIAVFLDVVALYATILSRKLPICEFKELSDEDISNLKTQEVD